jgi:hypothetical protein
MHKVAGSQGDDISQFRGSMEEAINIDRLRREEHPVRGALFIARRRYKHGTPTGVLVTSSNGGGGVEPPWQ